jgi:hypothetical protein
MFDRRQAGFRELLALISWWTATPDLRASSTTSVAVKIFDQNDWGCMEGKGNAEGGMPTPIYF